MITYSTADAGTLAFSSAPAIATAPRSLPEKSLSDPMSLPTGVRAPATITDVVIFYLQGVFRADVTDHAYAIRFRRRYRWRYDRRAG